MRRAAVSLTNNIAEGHGRFHYQENIRFLRQARGSLQELIDDVNVCLDEKYADAQWLASLKQEGYQLLKQLNGYIKYLRKRKLGELGEDELPIQSPAPNDQPPITSYQSPITSHQLPVRGFTLMELLVVVVIFGGIMGALLISFLVSRSSYLSADSYVHVQQEARRAFDVMVRELREAGNVDATCAGCDPNEDFTDRPRANFQVALSYNAGTGAIVWGNENQQNGWVHYLLNQTVPTNWQLVRCLSNGSDTNITNFAACRVLANNVQTFQVDYANASRTVTISLEIRQTSSQLPGGAMGTSPAPLNTQVRLRNAS